ncbi:MAG: T9SS type A sorting domain-containing protein, partial [Candidatus Cloacimonetes bacterium]|nr:T9SS type A sorting domain-containing protein [Candidatus Cloacimonadota bacterium]
YFEVHDDSTVVNAQGVDCSWFLGFLDLADAALPDRFYLSPNHPNPFNPSTTISFGLPREMRLRAEIFNLRGQRVAVLHDGPMPAGNHQMIWNAGDSASGMYVLVLSTEDGIKRQKMLLVR